MKLLLKNIKENYNKEEKQEGDNFLTLKKVIFLFRDDFRNCSDSDQYPLNLMLFLGLPKDNWEKYYFESLQDIKSNKKRFMEWAKN